MKEIELLYKINSDQAQVIRKKLADFFVKKVLEIDTYFYPPHKDFAVSENGRENLRTRQSGHHNELTYKKVIYRQGIYSHSIEKNVNISDTNTAIQILKSIGFRIHLVVEKQREIFKEDEFQITIDDIKDLGVFLEIEWTGKDGDEKEIKQSCQNRAKELGLFKIQDNGYLRLIEEKANNK